MVEVEVTEVRERKLYNRRPYVGGTRDTTHVGTWTVRTKRLSLPGGTVNENTVNHTVNPTHDFPHPP